MLKDVGTENFEHVLFEKLLEKLRGIATSGRKTYVIFMTDGGTLKAPSRAREYYVPGVVDKTRRTS